MCNRTTPDVDVEFREDIMLETLEQYEKSD